VGCLRDLAALYMRFAAENPAYYDLMFVMRKPMEMVHDENDFPVGNEAFQVLKDIITACIDKKLVRYDNAEIGAMLCWSTMHGLISLYQRKRLIMIECKIIDPENMDSFLQDATAAFLKTIIIDPAS
ncbi:MAG TPA: TetR-like C-terminal domain-containing protein, partial [Chitinophaga sp.]